MNRRDFLGCTALGAALSAARPLTAADAVQPASSYPPVPPGERLVGLAYTTWHRDLPWHDVWGTPELGYYRSDDRAVTRRHADWLAGAGVDFVFVDWSNDVDYFPAVTKNRPDFAMIEGATGAMFEEWSKLERHPRIAIMLGTAGAPPAATDGRLQRKADQVWDTFAANPRYRPLLQEYLGRPLLIVYANTPTPYGADLPWNDERFTVRWMTGYVTEQGDLRTPDLVSKYGYWSWEDRGPQTFTVHDGRPEAMVVTASWRAQGEPGDPYYIASAGRRAGATFHAAWERARAVGPRFALVVSWNEWVRGEQPTTENSKDLEPSKELGRRYLDLLTEEIARFKGR